MDVLLLLIYKDVRVLPLYHQAILPLMHVQWQRSMIIYLHVILIEHSRYTGVSCTHFWTMITQSFMQRYLHHRVGPPKQSTISYLDLIGLMLDICMYSLCLLNKSIKLDLELEHDVESQGIGCQPTNKIHTDKHCLSMSLYFQRQCERSLRLSEHGSCALYVVSGKMIVKHIVRESFVKLFNKILKETQC